MPSLMFSVLSVLSVLPAIIAAPVGHQSGGAEHIILLNATDPSTPSIAAILGSLSLSESHDDVKHIYNNSAFLGFSARMKTHCLDILANTTGVTHIEPAVRVASSDLDSITDSPWGLQRLSSSAVSIDGDTDELNYTYTYSNNLLGKGADIYVIDTGIFTQHIVFGGRATMGWSFDGNMTDDDGHGTHVSGIAAGERVGVAQGANLIGVRVLGNDGGGWSSDVVKGVDWALQQHTLRSSSRSSPSSSPPPFAGSVFSLSLSSDSPIQALTQALNLASKSGIHIVIAAGNSDKDACTTSPSNIGGTSGPALVIGSIAPNSAISTFSNTGACVDVYAAGENVVSAWPPLTLGNLTDDSEIKALSGTSMATPFVTGLVAYAIAGNETLAASTALMKEWVRGVALDGVVRTREGVVDGDCGLLANNGVAWTLAREETRQGDKGGFLGATRGE